jgi:DNA-binding transcriptional LysR family regulator
VNIRQLRYFLAVAQELNFTRAAERLHIAQPPLSQQIIALEEELGTQLFTREKRRVQLTLAGEILVEHAQRVLNAAATAVTAVRAAGRGAHRSLTVGAIYSAIYAFLPDTLRIFRAIEPETDVSLQEMTITQQIAALKEGAIEIGLVRGHIYEREIVSELLYRELLVVAVTAGTKYDKPEPVDIHELAEWPLIAVARLTTRGYADRVLEIFEHVDLQPHIVTEVRDMHTSVCFVAAEMGVAVVPAITQLMKPRGVAFRPIRQKTHGVSFSLAWRRNPATPSLDSFLTAARQNAASITAAHPELFMRGAAV